MTIDNFQKKFVISVISIAKPKNIVIFAFTMLESFTPFYGDFCRDLYSVASCEVMKRGNEALTASSLQFLSSVKCFIASSLQFFLSVTFHRRYFLWKTHRLTLHHRYFLKEFHCLTLHRHYFLN